MTLQIFPGGFTSLWQILKSTLRFKRKTADRPSAPYSAQTALWIQLHSMPHSPKYPTRTESKKKGIIRSSLSVIKLRRDKKKKFYLLWWLWVNVLQDREALWAASCPSPVWEEPSTRQRPVEMQHPVHPPHSAQRFPPGATKHPETENTMSQGVTFRPSACYFLLFFFFRRCHCCTDIWDICVCRGTYSEDGVMVVQSGPSLTGVAGYGEHHNLCFITLLLLKDTANKQPDTTTKNQNRCSLNL